VLPPMLVLRSAVRPDVSGAASCCLNSSASSLVSSRFEFKRFFAKATLSILLQTRLHLSIEQLVLQFLGKRSALCNHLERDACLREEARKLVPCLDPQVHRYRIIAVCRTYSCPTFRGPRHRPFHTRKNGGGGLQGKRFRSTKALVLPASGVRFQNKTFRRTFMAEPFRTYRLTA
jgi:hypothetical protein